MARVCLVYLLICWIFLSTPFLVQSQNPSNISIQCLERDCHMSTDFKLICPSSRCQSIPQTLDPGLRELNLTDNLISEIPESLDFVNLTSLDLSRNNITSIKNLITSHFKSLEELQLSNNKIQQVESDNFKNLPNLKRLFLGGNNLKSLDGSLFFHSPSSLQCLDLSNNQIESMDHNALTDLRNLETLYLNNNYLKSIEEEHFLGLDKLKTLQLDNNLISSISPKAFHQCRSLNTLDLSFNNMTTLEANTFDSGLESLKVLKLQANRLSSTHPDAFYQCPKLLILVLDNNFLDDIPSGLPNSLEKISMSNMPSLKRIKAGNIKDNSNLRDIFINNCPLLSEIEPEAFGGEDSAVESLELSRNALTYIPHDLVEWKQLKDMDLNGNPWNCDCKMEWVKEVYIEKEHQQTIICQNPSSLRGRSVDTLHYSDFKCSHISLAHGGMIALALLASLSLFILMTILVMKTRRRINKYLRSKKQSTYVALYDGDHDADDWNPESDSCENIHFDRYSEERKCLTEKKGNAPECV